MLIDSLDYFKTDSDVYTCFAHVSWLWTCVFAILIASYVTLTVAAYFLAVNNLRNFCHETNDPEAHQLLWPKLFYNLITSLGKNVEFIM